MMAVAGCSSAHGCARGHSHLNSLVVSLLARSYPGYQDAL